MSSSRSTTVSLLGKALQQRLLEPRRRCHLRQKRARPLKTALPEMARALSHSTSRIQLRAVPPMACTEALVVPSSTCIPLCPPPHSPSLSAPATPSAHGNGSTSAYACARHRRLPPLPHSRTSRRKQPPGPPLSHPLSSQRPPSPPSCHQQRLSPRPPAPPSPPLAPPPPPHVPPAQTVRPP